ncbi:MAG: gliding motility-associated C-terminal domain-containing protein [Crocinitomicaceae bacterium]|nr:gliding motility-associated C-terminal domain-containing protein [Crocinitomicaceae bacterium]
MQTLKRLFFAFTFLLIIPSNLLATHVVGGNIAYECTGNPNEFLVTLTTYRDCGGVSMSTPTVNFSNDCGFAPFNVNMTLSSFGEVSQLCAAEVPNSECSGGSLPGVEEYIYTAIVTLDPVCDSWTMSYEVGNRNSATNLSGGVSNLFYVESTINSATASCNNSPVITSQPIPYVCANVPVSYDFGALESDGNTLVFSLVNALGTLGTPITYIGGYTATEPIPGMTINATTGQLNFTPTVPGNFVVTILIEEFDVLGNLVGTMMQDIQFFVQICPNTPPNAPIGITNFDNFGTNAVLNGNTITLCTADQFCFEVVFDDPDLGENLVLSSNIDLFLPGATFTQTGTNPAIAQICWTFQPGYTGSIISVVATDEVCPIPGIASFSIELDVPPPLNAGTDGILNICDDAALVNLFNSLGGSPQIGGLWFDENGDPINPLAMPDTLQSGIYEYVIGDVSTSCFASAEVDVTVTGITANWVLDSLSNGACGGADDGTAYVNNITGTGAPFDVEWLQGAVVIETSTVNSGGTAYQNDLAIGNYTVSITNQEVCNWSQTFSISEPPPLELDFISNEPTCFGFPDGSVTANLVNGVLPYTFVMTNSAGTVLNLGGTTAINQLVTGWYYTSVTDGNGCFVEDSVFLDQPEQLAIDLILSQPLCYGFNTGVAFVDTVYNHSGSYNNVSFFWNPNPAGLNGVGQDSCSQLGPGDYALTINDAAGCSNVFDFTITYPDSLYFVELGTEPAYCRVYSYQSGNGVVYAAAAGGNPDYTYVWTNLSTGQNSSSTTWGGRNPGQYQIVATDDNGCTLTSIVTLDSLNPIADFEMTSPQFTSDYFGTATVDVHYVNQSLYFANPNDPLADTSFFWNFNSPDGTWIFSDDLVETFDSTYTQGAELEICLVAINKNGCKDTLCKPLVIYDPLDFTPVNIFTPDGDGVNDDFSFEYYAKGVSDFSCIIVNRWGVEITELNAITQSWDGTDKNGDPVKDGVYFYSYTGSAANGTPFFGQGTIQVINSK